MNLEKNKKFGWVDRLQSVKTAVRFWKRISYTALIVESPHLPNPLIPYFFLFSTKTENYSHFLILTFESTFGIITILATKGVPT